jgi:hypothetical protein
MESFNSRKFRGGGGSGKIPFQVKKESYFQGSERELRNVFQFIFLDFGIGVKMTVQ